MPIAWELLSFRDLARAEPTASALNHFGELGLKSLRIALAEWRTDRKLPPNPTMADALYAIAGLGGHIRNNGTPGWIVLGRGFERFTQVEAALRALASDQS